MTSAKQEPQTTNFSASNSPSPAKTRVDKAVKLTPPKVKPTTPLSTPSPDLPQSRVERYEPATSKSIAKKKKSLAEQSTEASSSEVGDTESVRYQSSVEAQNGSSLAADESSSLSSSDGLSHSLENYSGNLSKGALAGSSVAGASGAQAVVASGSLLSILGDIALGAVVVGGAIGIGSGRGGGSSTSSSATTSPSDNVAPTINPDGIAVAGYESKSIGQKIELTITFSESVTGLVAGTANSTIFKVGGTGKLATWGGAGNSRILTYTIGPSDDGQAIIDETALKAVLSAAGIKDGAGNALIVATITDIDTGAKALQFIDNTPPTISSVSITGTNNAGVSKTGTLVQGDKIKVELTMSEVVAQNFLGGPPSYKILLDGGYCVASYSPESTSKKLVFYYTISAGDADLSGGIVGASELTLPLHSTLKDAVGNVAKLTLPSLGSNSIRVDSSIPSVLSSTITGVEGSTENLKGSLKAGDRIKVELTMSENVTVTGNPTYKIMVGSFPRSASYAPGSSSSTKLVFYYTIGSGDADNVGGITAEANALTLPSVDAIKNTSNTAVDLNIPLPPTNTLVVDNVAPTISSVSITGANNAGVSKTGTLVQGDKIQVELTMSESTTVTGIPTYKIMVGSNERFASFASGSGSTKLVFYYTIGSGDVDSDGIAAAANALNVPPGGALKDGALNDAITNSAAASNSTIVVDSSIPSVLSSTITGVEGSTENLKGSLKAGDRIKVVLTMSESVTVTGNPTYKIMVGSTLKDASFASGSGSTNLVFYYTIESGDADSVGGITAASDALNVPLGGSLVSKSSPAKLVDLNIPLPPTNTLVVDNVAPTISSVSITGANNAGVSKTGTLVQGDKIQVELTMSESVTVTGIPTYKIMVGSTEKLATYSAEASSATKLVFYYTIGSGDADNVGGITAEANALTLPSVDAIKDASNTAVDLNIPLPGANTLVVDAIAPTISSVSITGANNAGVSKTGTLVQGDKIQVELTMSESTTVTGIPTYKIMVGSNERFASFASGSGSTKLVFYYTIGSGDADSDGIAAAANALNVPPGGALKDGALNDAITNSAAASNSTIVVDGSIPSVLSSTITGVEGSTENLKGSLKAGDRIKVELTMSESVTVTGIPTYKIMVGSTEKLATYSAEASSATKLVFYYTIGSGDADNVGGITAEANALTLPSVDAIKDASNTAVDLNIPLPGANTLVVDAIAPTISSVSITGANNAGVSKTGTLVQGDKIQVELTMSESTTVTGIPTYKIMVGSNERFASFASGSGSTKLVFYYTIGSGDADSDGIAAAANALNVPPGGALKDGALNDAITNSAAASNSTIVVDSSIPSVLSIAMKGISDIGLPKTGTLVQGDKIQVELTMSESVTVTGIPTYKIMVGSTEKLATYSAEASSATKLVFYYTVGSGDADSVGGITAEANALTLPSVDAIKNTSNTAVDLNIPLPPTNTLVVDNVAPTISSVSITGANNAGVSKTGTLVQGDKIQVELTMSENTTVTGNPTYKIMVGSTLKDASFASGSGSTKLVFYYTIESGDADNVGGITAGTGALNASGSTFLDGALNDANLTLPSIGTNAIVVDAIAPTISSVSITGANNAGVSKTGTLVQGDKIQVELTMSENTTVTGNPTYKIMVGSTLKDASFASGSGSTKLVFYYTIGSGDADSDGIAAAANALNVPPGGALKDGALNDAITNSAAASNSTIVVDSSIPSVLSSTITGVEGSTENLKGSLKAGDRIKVVLTMSESVTVTGNPTYKIMVGSNERVASFASSSSSATELVFYYTIGSGDADSVGGITAEANALTLPSVDAIKDASNTAVDLNIPLPPTNTLVVDNVAPTISSVSITGANNAGVSKTGTLVQGDKIQVELTMSESTTVTGIPTYKIMVGSNERFASFASGSGSTKLVFYYTIGSGDADSDGIAAAANALNVPPGGALKDGALNDAITNSAAASNSTIVVDGSIPSVLFSTITGVEGSTENLKGSLKAGDRIKVVLTTSEDVTVTGNPTYKIMVGSTLKDASFASGSGSTNLVFYYTIGSGDADNVGGITAEANALTLPSVDAIKNTSNTAVDLNIPLPPTNTLVVDNVAPTISSVSITGANNAGVSKTGTLVQGDKIQVELTMSENTTVTGIPTYKIMVGSNERFASFASGSGSTKLVFYYTIGSGDADSDGIAAAANALNVPPGGALKDGALNDANLTLPSIGTNAIVVDAIAPTISSVSITGANNAGVSKTGTLVQGDKIQVELTMSESTTVTGIPTYKIMVGSNERFASFASGSGSTKLVFYYTIGSGDVDSDGIAAAANALNVPPGGALKDGALNDAITNSAAASNSTIVVDSSIPSVLSSTITGVEGSTENLKGSLKAGDRIKVVLTMSESVTVTGNPTYKIMVGSNERVASFASSSSSATELVFYYTIGSGDADNVGGITAEANALTLPSVDAIKDASNTAVDLNIPLPPTNTLVVDNVAPTISSVSITGANNAGVSKTGTLVQGDKIQVELTMSESTTVTGIPTYKIMVGSNERFASFASGSGSTKLVFYYTIGSGDADSDGIAAAANALNVPPGGALKDGALNDANLTLPSIGTNAIVVDAIAFRPIELSSIASGIGGFVINGSSALEGSGYSVSSAGDINGDGLADLIIGAPYANNSAGRSYVVFGKSNSSSINLSAIANGVGGFVINGISNDSLGFSVSGAGDVNGDGLDDLLVGQPIIDGGDRLTGSYIIYGKTTTNAVNVSSLTASMGYKIYSPLRETQVGFSVSVAGDVNGDGLADLIVGAPYEIANGAQHGLAYVVFGSTNRTLDVDVNNLEFGTNPSGFAIHGEANPTIPSGADGMAGYSVSAAGDVNGDGLADLIIGARAMGMDGLPYVGKSYVVFGKAGSATVELSGVAAGGSGVGFVINNDAWLGDNDWIRWSGHSVSSAGDVNGDGLADLVVSANGLTPIGGHINKAFVIFGKATDSQVVLTSIAAGSGGFVINGESNFGDDAIDYSVSSAGDVNGDGLADLIIGVKTADPSGRENAGRSYVVFGKTTTDAINLSALVRGVGGFVINGETAEDGSGVSVSAAGDVNGDGLADLIVGAQFAGVSKQGRSYVIFGGQSHASIVDWMGSSANDVYNGLSNNEVAVGGAGDDVLRGNGGRDVLYGGSGNDTFELNQSNIDSLGLGPVTGTDGLTRLARIDGGSGIDTILMNLDASIDLTIISNTAMGAPDIGSRISSIEKIDLLAGAGVNSLTLAAKDVLDMTSIGTFKSWGGPANVNYHQLVVDGDSNDRIEVEGDWTNLGTLTHGSQSYVVYQSDTVLAQLLIDSDIIRAGGVI